MSAILVTVWVLTASQMSNFSLHKEVIMRVFMHAKSSSYFTGSWLNGSMRQGQAPPNNHYEHHGDLGQAHPQLRQHGQYLNHIWSEEQSQLAANTSVPVNSQPTLLSAQQHADHFRQNPTPSTQMVLIYDQNHRPFQMPLHVAQSIFSTQSSNRGGVAATALPGAQRPMTQIKKPRKDPKAQGVLNEQVLKSLHWEMELVRDPPSSPTDTTRCYADRHGHCQFCSKYKRVMGTANAISFQKHFVCKHPSHGPGGASYADCTPSKQCKHIKGKHAKCLKNDGSW